MSSHSAPRRSARSGCRADEWQGGGKGEKGPQASALLPSCSPSRTSWWQTRFSLFAEHTALGTNGHHPCRQVPNTFWASQDPEKLRSEKKWPRAQRWLPSKSPSCGEDWSRGRAGGGMPPAGATPAAAWTLVTAMSWWQPCPLAARAALSLPHPRLSSPVIVYQQSQAPIVPRSFPQEGVHQDDELQARKGDRGQGARVASLQPVPAFPWENPCP